MGSLKPNTILLGAFVEQFLSECTVQRRHQKFTAAV